MLFVRSNESLLVMRAEITPEKRIAPAVQIGKGLPRWIEAPLALIGLIFAAPVIALLSLAIALSSGLPVLFRQKRVGRYGRIFVLYKLRTMEISENGPQVTIGGDVRVTRLGKFLRRTKLDESPALWNVLRGDMSLVGPRPEVPSYVNLDDPLWQVVLSARPGLTDPVTLRLRNEENLLAQVNGDSLKYYAEELQPAKLQGYVEYLKHRNARRDLNVFCQTIGALVFSGRNSSSLHENQFSKS